MSFKSGYSSVTNLRGPWYSLYIPPAGAYPYMQMAAKTGIKEPIHHEGVTEGGFIVRMVDPVTANTIRDYINGYIIDAESKEPTVPVTALKMLYHRLKMTQMGASNKETDDALSTVEKYCAHKNIVL